VGAGVDVLLGTFPPLRVESLQLQKYNKSLRFSPTKKLTASSLPANVCRD